MSQALDTEIDVLHHLARRFDGLRPDQCRLCTLRDREMLLLDSGGAAVVPSLGALIEGWLLVVPTRHVQALAELTDQEWAVFRTTTDLAVQLVEKHYGSTVSFEHGPGGLRRSVGCGVDHAHMHIVPTDVNLRAAIAATADDLGNFAWSAAGTRPRSVGTLDYIWLSDASGCWIHHAEDIPSQVVRRALARLTNQPTWDWKDDHRLRTVSDTLRTLAIK